MSPARVTRVSPATSTARAALALPVALLLAACADAPPPTAPSARAPRPSLVVAAGAGVVDLGGLAGSSSNYANGIADDGTVVGQSILTSRFDVNRRAVTFAGGATTALPAPAPTDTFGEGKGISPSGAYAVGHAYPTPVRYFRGMLWTSTGFVLLRPLGCCGTFQRSDPEDVNDAGVAVGESPDDLSIFRATRWDAEGNPTPLDAGPSDTWANGINAGGTIVGRVSYPSFGYNRPVRWLPGSTTKEWLAVPDLPGGQVQDGTANDVNAAGLVVGRATWPVNGTGAAQSAAVWFPDGHLVRLPDPPEGGDAEATGINDRNMIVGNIGYSSPIYWRPNASGGWDAPEPLPVPAGMTTAPVSRINNAGEAVGSGCCAPKWHALRWTIPLPNRAPTASAGGPYAAVVEGSAVSFAGSGADPDGDALTYAWDLDHDGTFETPGSAASRTFADDGSYLVDFRVTDASGASAVATAKVVVTNAAPTIKLLKLDPAILNAPAAGQRFPVSWVFGDRGLQDGPWGWTIAWGDGTTSSGATGTQAQIDASHVYGSAGDRTLRFTITDKDGASATRTIPVTVRP